MIYDRKIRRLTPSQRWLWIAVLSMASTSPKPGYLLLSDVCNDDVTLQDRYSNVAVTVSDLADVAAIPVSDVESGMDTFIKQQMIHIENGVYVVTNWSKRQFQSDSSADRVRKFRQSKCNGDVTLQDRYSNADVTPPDTDTETELKINVRVRSNEYTEDFLEFWNEYPRKVDKGAAFKQWKARLKEGVSPNDLILAARNYAAMCKQLNTEERYIKHAKTFLGVSRSFEEYLTPVITESPKKYIDPELEEEMRFRAQVVSGTYEPH
jgi:hypothetical protein